MEGQRGQRGERSWRWWLLEQVYGGWFDKNGGCRAKSWFRDMARMHISPAGSLVTENLENKAQYVSCTEKQEKLHNSSCIMCGEFVVLMVCVRVCGVGCACGGVGMCVCSWTMIGVNTVTDPGHLIQIRR